MTQYKNLATILAGALLAMFLQTSAFADMNSYNGYLADVLCATKGKSPSGVKMFENPEQHRKSCMLMRPCKKSGFGVIVKGDDGKYSYTKFDKKGSKLAEGLLKKTKRKDNMHISVTGKMDGDTLAVTSMSEN